jgi:hypothetical protein
MRTACLAGGIFIAYLIEGTVVCVDGAFFVGKLVRSTDHLAPWSETEQIIIRV